MSVDRNEKIWAYSNTGVRAHAFVQAWADKDGKQSTNHLRAMCRGTIARHADSLWHSKSDMAGICTRCETLANAMWDRAEASMQPATETVTVQGQPAETLADAQAIVVQELRAAASIDAAHAEAIETDVIETAKVELTGKTFRPTSVNLAWSKDARATVTDVVFSPAGAVRVIFTVEDEGTWTAGAQLGVFQRSWTAEDNNPPSRGRHETR